MTAYYNELDPFAAQWLRNLIAAGHIAPGEVDERDIRDVRPHDLQGFAQCHFFAGIGGWSLALRLAGWPDERPVWTGSCPCQPFSVAGLGRGFDDERHLWPFWHFLVEQCRPPVVFGEQVAGASRWLGLVRGDLEALGYTVGAIPLEAASAGADHFRDRYWFVADHSGDRGIRGEQAVTAARYGCALGAGRSEHPDRALADCDGLGIRVESRRCVRANRGRSTSPRDLAEADALADRPEQRLEVEISQSGTPVQERAPSEGICLCHVVDDPSLGWGEGWAESEFRSRGFTAAVANIGGCQYLECPDGKWRRLPPPRVRWLGNGSAAAMDRLRAIEIRSQEAVNRYAENSKTDPDQILQMVRETVRAEACWEEPSVGMRFKLPSAQVLLDFLLCIESARQTENGRRIQKTLSEAQLRIVRGMRQCRGDSGPPRRRESIEQQPVESPDTLLELSFVLARDAEAYQQETRSAHAISDRVAKLRALSNAIDPRPAAEFVRAYLECRP